MEGRVIITHPLLIDLILEKVFLQLKPRDLKSSRLVCQTWSQIGYKVLSNRSKTSILFGDSSRSKDLEQFTNAMKSGIKLPFSSFTMQHSVFSLHRSHIIQDFFATSQNHMKSLFLAYQNYSHYVTSQNQQNFQIHTKKRHDFLDFHLPSLTHLRFEILPADQLFQSASAISADELFSKIFNSARNLVRLELIISPERGTKSDPYVRTICSSSQTIHRQLSELVLNCFLNDDLMDSLKNTDYQFKMLRVKFRGSQFHRNSPIGFIQKNSSSLEKLKLDPWVQSYSQKRNFHKQVDQFPCLENLKILEILEWKPFQDSSPLPFEFSFGKSFPRLRKLTFQSHHWQGFFSTFFPQEIVRTVSHLKLPKHIGVDSSNLVSKISNCFPGLVKLEIFISTEIVHSLSDIFTQLPQLEELSVSFLSWNGSRCLDYIFTGIPESVCRNIYSVNTIPEVDLRQVQCGPSIRDLKGLRRLQLRNMSMFSIKGRPQYTDITGYHSLLKMENLTSLSIWPSQMSKECLHELGKRFTVTLHSF